MQNTFLIQEDVPLAPFSTFKIGGHARYFFEANRVEELKPALAWAQKKHLSVFILGGGTNILVNDNGFNGLVVKICFKEARLVGDILEVGAGANVILLAHKLAKKGWQGLEWAGGLPGTVGGAIRGNAGAYRQDIGSQTISVTVFHKGKMEELKAVECEFGYRTSIFKTKRVDDIIIKANLRMEKGNSQDLLARLKELNDRRFQHQPKKPSAGCAFANYLIKEEKEFSRIEKIKPVPNEFREYKKIPAAWLIEQSGLKGARVGGAKVSCVHASFIINSNHANAQDVWELMRQVKQAVYNVFHIELEEEVELVGFDGLPPVVN